MKTASRPAYGKFDRLSFGRACILSVCANTLGALRRLVGKSIAPLAIAAALFLLPGAAFPSTGTLTGGGTLTGSFDQGEFTLTMADNGTLQYTVSNVGSKAVSLTWELTAPEGSLSEAAIASGAFGWFAGTEGEIVREQVKFDVLAGNTILFVLSAPADATLKVTAITLRSLPPQIDSLSPSAGSRSGSYNVTLLGSGFDADQDVYFGSIKATIVSRSETALTVTVPPSNSAGDVSVVVKSGTRASNSLNFNYTAFGPAAILTAAGTYTLFVNQPITPFMPVKQDPNRTVDGTLSYSSSNLPAGLRIDPQTGYISGTPTALSNGSVSVTLTNGTDSNASSSTKSFTLIVSKNVPSVTLAVSNPKPKYSEAVKLTVTIGVPAGAAVPSGSVDFLDGGTKIGAATLSAGKAEFTVSAPLKIGVHEFKAVWAGDANYIAASSSTVTVTPSRPDPNLDKNVRALVASQVAAAQRFANSEIDAVQRRLEALHHEDVPAFVNGLSVSQAGDTRRDRTSDDPAGPGTRTAAAPAKTTKPPANPYGALPDSRFKIWTSGAIIFGGVNVSSLGVETKTHFTLSGITAGVDTKLMDGVKGGFAISYSGETSNIGTDGTRLNSRSVLGSVYGSWNALSQVFLDGMIGYGGVSFDGRRYDANAASFITGDRRGRMLLGSLSLSYEEKSGALSLAPFVRLDALAASLGEYKEEGDENWTLTYQKSMISSQTVVLGLRSEYAMSQTWDVLSPTARLEYRRILNGDVTQTMSYANEPETSYALTTTASDRNILSSAFGLKARGDKDVTGALEYLLSGGVKSGLQGQGVRGSVRVGF